MTADGGVPVGVQDTNDEQGIASTSLPSLPDSVSSLSIVESGKDSMGDTENDTAMMASGGGVGVGVAHPPDPDDDAHNQEREIDADDDEDHALAQLMMAFQEEHQDEVGSTDDVMRFAANGEEAVAMAPPQHANNINNNNVAADVDDLLLPNNNPPPPHHLHHQYSILRTLISLFRPSLRYVPLSFLSAFLLIHHTLRTRQQFYLAMTYLSTSKLSYIILGNAIIAYYVKIFTLVTHLFLGGLRPNERESIGEQMRWDITETCLALTMFRSELDVGTAIKFLTLVVMKGLHWSVELRGGHLRMTEEIFAYPDEEGGGHDDANHDEDPDHLSRSKQAWYHRLPSLRLTHIRYYTLVQILLSLDILAVSHCALSVVAAKGRSVDVLFGFEATILLVSGLSSLGLYNLHVIDGIMGVFHHLAEGEHHYVPVGGMADPTSAGHDEDGRRPPPQDQQPSHHGEEAVSDNRVAADHPPARRTKSFAKRVVEYLAIPWRDRRATLALAIELQAQAAKFLFYSIFFAVVLTNYGMPINIFREVYVSFQLLRRRLIAFNNYRRLTHNMDSRFESIKDEEELDKLGHSCIICRDQMDLLGGCKKLPGCGHAFHTHCLREWLVQQQTCPTCRSDIVANEARRKKRLEQETAAARNAANAATELRTGGDGAEITASSDVVIESLEAESRTVSRTVIDTNASPSMVFSSSHLNKDIMSPHLELGSPRFPCLYRTLPLGAPVFSSLDSCQHTQTAPKPKRVIPQGQLVVSTSIEFWPAPFQEAMLCIPDGYVRCRDVERFLILSSSTN